MGAEFCLEGGGAGGGICHEGWSLSVTPRQICAQALQWMEEPVCLGLVSGTSAGAPPSLPPSPPPSPQAERGRTLVRDEDTVLANLHGGRGRMAGGGASLLVVLLLLLVLFAPVWRILS